MSNYSQIPALQCSSCGIRIPDQLPFGACPSCGVPLGSDGVIAALSATQQEALSEYLTNLDVKLLEAGAQNAEDALSMGCGRSIVLIILAGILGFFLSRRDLVITVVIVSVFLLLTTWGTMLLSNRAKSAALQRAFQDEIKPQIDEYIRAQHVGWPQFERVALSSLPVGSPLRKQLGLPDIDVTTPDEEGEDASTI